MGLQHNRRLPTGAPATVLGSFLWAASLTWLLAACSGEPRPVQIAVVFSVDTLRADQLGPWGGPPGLTPNVDRLALESLRFKRAYSQSSVTHPALAALFTGLLPSQNGVIQQTHRLVEGLESVPAHLAREGIHTASFTANLCRLQDLPGTIFHDGWDVRYCGMLDDPEDYRDQWEWDRAVVDAGLAWLENQRKPGLLWLHLMDPHAEHRPPPHLWDYAADPPRERFAQSRYYEGLVRAREFPPPHEFERLWALYRAEIVGVDEQLGRFLEALDAHPLAARSALIFTADHGEELFETWPYHGHGSSPTEGVLHVPLLVRAPDLEPGVQREPVELLQIAPTLLEWFGLVPTHPMAGGSLLRLQPSRGYAVSQPPGLGTTLRTSRHRLWVPGVGPDLDPPVHEAGGERRRRVEQRFQGQPWHEQPVSLAGYSPNGGWQPHYVDPADPTWDRTLGRLLGEVENLQRRFPAPGSAREELDDPHLLRQLAELGYAGYDGR